MPLLLPPSPLEEMEIPSKRDHCTAAPTPTFTPPFHTVERLRRTTVNRVFTLVYTCAILALLYRHAQTLVRSSSTTSFASLFLTLALLVADLVLAFSWGASQAFRMYPIRRKQFPGNLKMKVNEKEFPGLDVFICTADPYKEPPMSVVNTALSLMAYDYPTEKISVYVSDDGGSALTLFAFMEAAKFSSHWLPFCRKNNIVDRSPDVYLAHSWTPEANEIKEIYENMKVRIENVVNRGEVSDTYITNDQEREAFDKWTDDFTLQDHPAVVQVLLDSCSDKDITGHCLPNLIYVSRQKSKTSPHHFKAGALNVLLRVSTIMTNAPIVQTQDCDMYSNDQQTPLRALCYVCDPEVEPNLGFVQFPQRFPGINKDDTYGCEYLHLASIHPLGLDGVRGPYYCGTGTFFRRRALLGDPSTSVKAEILDLRPDHIVNKPIKSPDILELAHYVASCSYENQNKKWGYKMGFRYGSLVEDFYTGYLLQCDGWMSVHCNPERPAFLGNVPINLADVLNQNKRWAVGLLEMGSSQYSPLTFGIQSMNLIMGLGYSHYALWPLLSIPVTIYAFLPQLALLHGVSLFPKISETWFFLYLFLFVGAYGQDLLEYVLEGSTFKKWFNAQRMWMIRNISSFSLGTAEYLLKSIGLSTYGFNVTNKVVDDEQNKRYSQGIFEFGVPSPLFVPPTMAAIISLFSFIRGTLSVLSGGNEEGLFLQMLLAGYIVVNCFPIYDAIALRSDKGKMPTKITIIAALLAGALCTATSIVFK